MSNPPADSPATSSTEPAAAAVAVAVAAAAAASNRLVPNSTNNDNSNNNSSTPAAVAMAQPPLQPPTILRRTSTSSSSKLHDVIQDIINQFDPLKATISASASAPHLTQQSQQTQQQQPQNQNQNQQPATDMQTKFEPESDGFNYNDFLQQLRHPAAKPLARTVKSFLTEFARRPMTLNEQVRFVHDFLDFIGDRMRDNPVWQMMDERQFENAREGMEKLVMNRLYHLCFSPEAADDAEKDHVVREKMGLFRWITLGHLDLDELAAAPQAEAFLVFARAELLKMNNFKAPRDKVICILNCCTVIYGLLKNLANGSRGPEAAGDVGADRFLPLLIYVVVTACPPKLVSNIQYISRFRSPERMQSEAGYYVTNLQGAVAFIESMDASCLSITQEEFDKHIEMTIWEMELEKRTKERTIAKQQLGQQQLGQQQLGQQQLGQQQLGQQQLGQQQKKSSLSPPQTLSQLMSQPQQDMPGERAQWLIDRSSNLAKSTLEKTNNFVGRLISEFSSPTQSEANSSSRRNSIGNLSSTPPGIRHSTTASRPPAQEETVDDLVDSDGRFAVGGEEWKAALAVVHDMFPNIDRDVVDIVFESNVGMVPRTIEQLLDISTDSETLDVAARRIKGREDSEGLLLDSPVIVGAADAFDKVVDVAGKGKALLGEVLQEDVVEEMEKWKDHWADDSSDSGNDDDEKEESVIPVAGAMPTEDTPLDVEPVKHKELELEPVASTSGTSGSLALPDTSGDEEYARKLQEEFERQAQISQPLPPPPPPPPPPPSFSAL